MSGKRLLLFIKKTIYETYEIYEIYEHVSTQIFDFLEYIFVFHRHKHLTIFICLYFNVLACTGILLVQSGSIIAKNAPVNILATYPIIPLYPRVTFVLFLLVKINIFRAFLHKIFVNSKSLFLTVGDTVVQYAMDYIVDKRNRYKRGWG